MIKSASTILVFVLTLSTSIHAQFLRGCGLKAGIVAANQKWNYAYSFEHTYDYKWGLTLGGFIEFLDDDYFSIVVEAQYTQKGMYLSIPVTTETQPDGTGEYITHSPRTDYLSLPLLLKVRYSIPVVTPYIIIGPRLDVLLSKNGDGFDVVIEKFDATDFGLTIGLGMRFSGLLPNDVLTEFRYNPNLNNSFDNNYLTVRNHSLDFMVGIYF